MATITFENGAKVNFEGNPTPQDVEEVAKSMNIAPSSPQTPPSRFSQPFPSQMPGRPDNVQGLKNLSGGVSNVFPGQQIGKAIGTLAGYAMSPNKSTYDLQAPNPLQVAGDAAAGAATIAGFKAPLPKSLFGSVGQFGALGAVAGGGQSLANNNSGGQILKDAAIGGAASATLGGVFNLLGKSVSSAGPTALSFTTGVPKEAIKQAAQAPTQARIGLNTSVEKVREKAVGSLGTLYTDLGKEFADSLDDVISRTGQTKAGMTYNQQGFIKSAPKIQNNLTEFGRSFAREFRLGTKMTPEGVVINFEKSPIIKSGEQKAVQEAFSTISNWDDFSARGMQDLAERIGALRNFESGAKTESSAIVGKIYNKIAGRLIPEFYPELSKLRTKYASSRKVLDEIADVLSYTKKSPVSIQSSITRLSNIFKTDRDTYLNIVRELSKRSGVDYTSLLAGTEFQRVLPDFIRGLGGGGALAVGAQVLNPYLLLLAPLFSPRFAGLVSRNANAIGNTVGTAARAGTTQAIRRFPPKEESR